MGPRRRWRWRTVSSSTRRRAVASCASCPPIPASCAPLPGRLLPRGSSSRYSTTPAGTSSRPATDARSGVSWWSARARPLPFPPTAGGRPSRAMRDPSRSSTSTVRSHRVSSPTPSGLWRRSRSRATDSSRRAPMASFACGTQRAAPCSLATSSPPASTVPRWRLGESLRRLAASTGRSASSTSRAARSSRSSPGTGRRYGVWPGPEKPSSPATAMGGLPCGASRTESRERWLTAAKRRE